MAREKCGILAVPRTAPVQLSRYVYTKMRSQQSYTSSSILLDILVPCKVLGTLRTTTALMRVFLKFNLTALCHSQVSLMLSTDINITETTYSCQFQYVYGNQ